MAYVVNGKTYTSYPLMDEIVYNCQLILKNIVVKNEYVAHLYETEESLYRQEILYRCIDGTMTFDTMDWSAEMFVAWGIDNITANEWVSNPSHIPTVWRDEILAFCIQYYIDNFVELNKYYRSLMGLPEYGTDRYNIYITPADLPGDFDYYGVDFTLPIHEQPSLVISALRANGRLDELIEEYRSFNYSYLRFLDNLAIDVYKARKALKWDILFIPTTVNALVLSRFQEIYEINRQIYLKRTYQTAYAYKSEYYDHMLILLLLSQTFTDMISDTPEWFIRKDIFDIRTVQFFLDAYGIPFFEEIPLRYQIRIVKNINKLIKYKSTQQNFEDIIDIFSLRGTNIYRYYIYKRRRTDDHGHYIDDPDLNKMYELLFIEVILGDTYDNYIKNLNYRLPYDEVTVPEEYWDGVDDHEYIKYEVLKKEFTIEPTKYLTLKAQVNYIDYQKQLVYLLGMILDTRSNLDDLTVAINSINEGTAFKLSDVFVFVELLNLLEVDFDPTIIKPGGEGDKIVPWDWDFYDEDDHYSGNPLLPVSNYEGTTITDYDFIYEDEPEPEQLHHDYNFGDLGDVYISKNKNPKEWWVRENFPELFVKYENRVFGFNPDANLTKIADLLARTQRLKAYNLREYNLSFFGVEDFIVPTEDIDTYERLVEVYETNMKCYENVNFILSHATENKFENLLARYVYMELFTKEYDYEFTAYKNTLSDILASRDYMLWSTYYLLTQATDHESRNKDISSILNEVVLNLEYYLDRDSLDYFFSFLSTNSFTAVSKYLYLMLNAFKSYKAHFIEPTIQYKFEYPDAMSGNYIEMADSITNRLSSFSKFDKEYIHDLMVRTSIKEVTDSLRERYKEILDIFKGYTPDPDDEFDYDGGSPNTDESLYEKEIDGTGAVMLVPYKTADNGFPYGRHGITRYQVDGKDESITDLESQTVLELDAGNITDDDTDFINSSTFYFQKYFSKNYNGGSSETEYIVNNNFFKRLYDYQDHQEMLVSARTGLQYTEDPDTGEAVLKEIWREWLSVTEFESVLGDPELLRELIDNDQFEEYYAQFLEDLDDGLVKVFLDELYNKKNHGIDLSLTDLPAEDAKKVPWDWDYYDEDDPDSGNPDLPISNYEDEFIDDYDFIDEDDPEPEQLHHDYNFGDDTLSRILWIENIYNQDTSRVLKYTL